MFILFSLTIIRISGAIALNPVFGRTNVPSRVKAASILVILFMFYIDLEGIPVHESTVTAKYGAMLIKELLFGFALGFGTELAFLAVCFTSVVMDHPMGPTMAQAYDPQYNVQMIITTGMYYAFMIILFLATNRHLRLFTIFFTFHELVPFGIVTFRPELAQAILPMFRENIAMRLQFTFPLITAELVAETAAGILMRTIPQISVSVANFQIKIVVDISTLLFLFSPISDRLYVTLNGTYQSLQQIVTLMRQEAGGKQWSLAGRNRQEKTERPTGKR